ncbi:MAG: hypothetical protein QF491_01110, partial [Alphaproteobacteria bacterium]|nr:hypothetical protein [Alphaproteobacteria bacterium]
MQFNLSRQTVGRLLVFATVFLCLASTGTEISYYLLDHKRLLGLVGQFSLGYEANVPTWYSSVLLLACAAVLAVIGFSRPPGKGGYRRHWLALAAIFAYMSLDEAAVLHEGLIPLTHYLAQPFGITLE